ncbi:hypothetical protein ACOME3_003076 [Neoechinorhynchus agilis]
MSLYTQKINQIKCAILIAVVNGKLSEGINFSDELARCVIMVGMPYPNVKAPEFVEELNYMRKLGDEYSRRHCEIVCWKSINQAIGRAVRHIKDYAAIVLLDERYTNVKTVSSQLPQWMVSKGQLQVANTVNDCVSRLGSFFQRKFKV